MSLGERVDALFSAYAGAVPGAAVTIVRDGKALLSKGYGLANISEKTLVTSSTNFRFASVSKAFTTICILKFVMPIRCALMTVYPNL